MKKYLSLLSSLILVACTHPALTITPAATEPVFGEAQLFGMWDCEIEAQRDYLHTFAPKNIVFIQRHDLPAHIWMGYIDNKQNARHDEIAIGYREFYSGWWNIKKENNLMPKATKVAMTIQYAGVERLHKIEEIKQKDTRKSDEKHVKYIEERSEKRNFKSFDFYIKPLDDGRIQMTDTESLIVCSKRTETSADK